MFRGLKIGLIIYAVCVGFGYGQDVLSVKDAIYLGRMNHPLNKSIKMEADIEKTDITSAGLRPNILFNNQSIFLTNRHFLDNVARRPGDENKYIPYFASPYSGQIWFQLTKQYQINGKRKAKIDYQKKDFEAATAEAAANIYELSFQTALQWLEAWYAAEVLENEQLAKENADSLFQTNIIRFNKKQISKNDLERARIVAEQHENSLYAAQRDYRSELLKLSYMVGEDEIVEIDNKDDFFFIKLYDNRDSLISLALLKRPELLLTQKRIETIKADVKLKQSQAVPNPEFGAIFNPQNYQPYWGWYFQMPIPVFDRNQGEIHKSKIMVNQAQSQQEALVAQVKSEIKYLWQDYITYKENSERYRVIIESSDAILSNVRDSYAQGKTSFVDYLYAKEFWFDTQKNYDEVVYKYRRSYLELLRATGLLNYE